MKRKRNNKKVNLKKNRERNMFKVLGIPNDIQINQSREVNIHIGEAVLTIGTSEYVNKIALLPSYNTKISKNKPVLKKNVKFSPKIHFSAEQFKIAMQASKLDLKININQK